MQREEGRGQHAAHHRHGDAAHHLGAGALAPEDRQQAGHDGDDGHHLRPHALDGAGDNRRAQIVARERTAVLAAQRASRSFKRLVEIDEHDDAGFGGDAGERDEADGDRDAHIVAEPPHEPGAADKREGHRQHDDERLGEPPEIEIEQHEDEKQRRRDDDAQLGRRALQIFELPAPFDVIAGRQFHLLGDGARGVGHIAAEIAALQIDIDIGDELRVLGADAGRPLRHRDARDLAQAAPWRRSWSAPAPGWRWPADRRENRAGSAG